WAYDIASGVWTRGPDPEAPARQLYGMAGVTDGALVFGGGSLDGGYLNDAWMIDPATLALTPFEASGAPSPRSGATVINDALRGRMLLFGGKNADGELADLWELSPLP
ncbi:MAG: hypothetical protein WD830_10550, partial [Chloroflexota bacterium]